MNTGICVLFTNGSEDPDMRHSVVLGPFDPAYIELTYGTLRVAPEGDHIAIFDGGSDGDGFWHIVTGTESVNEGETIRHIGQWHAPIVGEARYSDIDIYWKDV